VPAEITADKQTESGTTPAQKLQVQNISTLSGLASGANLSFYTSVWTMVALGPSSKAAAAQPAFSNPEELWRVPWQIVTKNPEARLKNLRLEGQLGTKICDAAIIFGTTEDTSALEGWLLDAVQRQVVGKLAYSARKLDGGFLNPRLNFRDARLPPCAIISDPVAAE